MVRAAVGIGTNLGDRWAYVEAARRGLARLPESRLLRFSSVWETAPVGPGEQERYLNAAAILETALAPTDLLRRLHGLEEEAGRVRQVRWGPRTLDLDLLLYGTAAISTPELTVPHPRMHERAFVLEPLAEVDAEARHPTQDATAAELLRRLHDGETPSAGAG